MPTLCHCSTTTQHVKTHCGARAAELCVTDGWRRQSGLQARTPEVPGAYLSAGPRSFPDPVQTRHLFCYFFPVHARTIRVCAGAAGHELDRSVRLFYGARPEVSSRATIRTCLPPTFAFPCMLPACLSHSQNFNVTLKLAPKTMRLVHDNPAHYQFAPSCASSDLIQCIPAKIACDKCLL